MADGPHSLTERLAQHLARDVAEAEIARARLHLLDWLGCVAGARRSDVATVAKAAEADALGRAALLGNVLEMDDVHRAAILHPGPVVWPSVLTAVRDMGGTIEGALAGAVRGYEAVIAVGSTFDAHHYSLWHNSSTAGGFGAVAGAASVYGLDQRQTMWALGNIGSIAGGLWQMRHSAVMTKQLHIAHAALAALWVVRLARQGFTGPASILEGPQGLYAATTREPKPIELSEGWRLDQVSFKPWAACRHTHPAIDGAMELKAKGCLNGNVRVETYADALLFCDRPEPATPGEAKFSLQHAVAVVAVRGEPRPEDFEAAAIADPDLTAMRTRIEVVEAPEISARYPDHFGARITAGGASADLIDCRGDPERPLGRDGIIGKARQLVDWGGLGTAEADRAVDTALSGSGDARPLLRLLEDWL
jgi:2-methylcitrate dehydratase PrpD